MRPASELMVHYPSLVTSPRHRAVIFDAFLTVAFRWGVGGIAGCLPQDFGIMFGQDAAHIWEASIADLDTIPVHYRTQDMISREVLV